jgi:chromate transporter
MLYLQLFISFFKIGLFGFGGGLAILSLIQIEVEQHGWMTQQEFVDIVAVSQVTPGPIGINCATYVGYTATGSVWGSMLTTFAIVLPSLIIMLAICRAYFWLSTHFQNNPYFTQTLRILRFTVIGLIASAALMLIKPTNFIDANSWILFGMVAFFTILPQLTESLTKRYPPLRKIVDISSHPILLIIAAGIAGYCIYA